MGRLFRLHCSEQDLVALLDRELSLPERIAIERHVGDCLRCAELVARHERAYAALREHLQLDAPVPAESPVDARVAMRAAGAGVLAGSVGALVVAGLLMHRHLRQHQRRSVPGAA